MNEFLFGKIFKILFLFAFISKIAVDGIGVVTISLLADLKLNKPSPNLTLPTRKVPNGPQWYPIVPNGTQWYPAN